MSQREADGFDAATKVSLDRFEALAADARGEGAMRDGPVGELHWLSVAEAAQAAGIPAGLQPPTGGWEALLQGRDL